MSNSGYVVVDFETTGVYNNDRIIEVGIVTLDSQLRPIDEYETLVDPQRDLGPTYIHGITPSMVSLAPVFHEIAAALATRVEGKTLVAHNLAFEARMLACEFERLGARLDPGAGICTLRLTGEKLPIACEQMGITPPKHHRALADARATAEILRKCRPVARTAPITVGKLDAEINPRTLRRCADEGSTVMHRLISGTSYRHVRPSLLSYIDLLDWALDDLLITDQERQKLNRLAADLDLSPAQVAEAHEGYFLGMLAGALKDSIITASEHVALCKVADALQISQSRVPAASDTNVAISSIPMGSKLCFTGSFVDSYGTAISKSTLGNLARRAGFEVTRDVTRSNCDFLVAVDPSSSSGKAKKARQYNKPIVAAAKFLELVS